MSGIEGMKDEARQLKGEVENAAGRVNTVTENGETIQERLGKHMEGLDEVIGFLKLASAKAGEVAAEAADTRQQHAETSKAARVVADEIGGLATRIVALLTDSANPSAEKAQTTIMHSHAVAETVANNLKNSEDAVGEIATTTSTLVVSYIADAVANARGVRERLEGEADNATVYTSDAKDAENNAKSAAYWLGEYADDV